MTTISNSDSGIFKLGDIVVGSTDPNKPVYSATGGKLIDNGVAVYGRDTDLVELQKEMLASIGRSGGKRLNIGVGAQADKKTSKKKLRATKSSYDSGFQVLHTTEEFHDSPVFEPTKVRLQSIQFENAFGKIKAKVEHVVEHDAAFMLVFSDADSMVFEPKTGESLVFYSVGNDRHDVYYPGVTFDSPDNNKKYMILFKLPEEN